MKLKTYIFLALLITIVERAESQIYIGPTLGAQYSWTAFGDKDYKRDFKAKPVFGYNVGGALSFRVRKRFFLTSSFLYSTKGKIIEGKADKTLREEVTFKFIEVPVIYSVDFKARLSDNDHFKYFFGIGPNLSYWLGGKGSLYNSDFLEANIPVRKFKTNFHGDPALPAENEMVVGKSNRVQLGLNLAAGIVAEPMPNQKFMVVARFEFGHSYFSSDSKGVFKDTYYQDELKSRNKGLRLSVYYMVDTKTEQRKKGKSTSNIKKIKRRR